MIYKRTSSDSFIRENKRHEFSSEWIPGGTNNPIDEISTTNTKKDKTDENKPKNTRAKGEGSIK